MAACCEWGELGPPDMDGFFRLFPNDQEVTVPKSLLEGKNTPKTNN